MENSYRDGPARVVKQLVIMGIFAVCVLALIQIVVALLLTGRLEHARREIRGLTQRVEKLEAQSPAPGSRRTTTPVRPARQPVARSAVTILSSWGLRYRTTIARSMAFLRQLD